MSVVNINRANTDSFYRYKMPRLQSKIEGKGNGIKTVIPNMEDIARSLCRPPSYPTKFFGCELGAQTQMDDKNSRYIVNGAHDDKTLSDLLDKFIKKFVLCPDCSNPETDMLIDKKKDIWLDCKACGARRKVDMLHKLCVFIINNPPPTANVGPSTGAKKKTKEERRRERNERAKAGKRTSDSDDDGDEKAGENGTASTADTLVASSNGTSLTATNAGGDEEDDSGLAFTPAITVGDSGTATPADSSMIVGVNEEFTVDEETVARARKQLAQGLNAAVKNLVVSKDEEAGEGEDAGGSDSYDDFATFLSSQERSAEEILTKIANEKLKDDKAIAVFVQVKFTDKILEELPQSKDLLVKIVKSEKAIKGLIGGLERLVGVTYPAAMSKFAKILKFLYDNDILEEDVILAWNDKISKKYVGDKEIAVKLRTIAKPLVDWLKTAEEESDSE